MKQQTDKQNNFKKDIISFYRPSFIQRMTSLVINFVHNWKEKIEKNEAEKKLLEEKKQFQAKVNQELFDNFNLSLSHQMPLLALELVFNGYQPSDEQKNLLKEVILDNIKKNAFFILELKKFNYPIDNDIILLWSYSHFNKIKSEENLKSVFNNIISQNFYQDLLSFILQQLKSETIYLLNNIFVEHKSIGAIGFKNREMVDSYHQSINYKVYLINNIASFQEINLLVKFHEELKNCQDIMINYLNSMRDHHGHYGVKYYGENLQHLDVKKFENYINDLNRLIQYKLNEKKDDLMKQANSLENTSYLTQVNKDIKSQMIHSLETLSIEKELSSLALQIVNNIHDLYGKIMDYSQFKHNIDFHQIESTYKTQLPTILKKYMTIDKSLRHELVNLDGKTSEELMILSLKNVEDILNNKFIEINQQKVSDLSVTHRMTNQMKKNM